MASNNIVLRSITTKLFLILTFIILMYITVHVLKSLAQSSIDRKPNPAEFDAIKGLKPDDEKLLNYIRKYHIYEPSRESYNLAQPNKDPSEFVKQLKSIFGGKKNGTFIECGANDGEFLSNTLGLEREHGWSGLLIEANPRLIGKLLSKNRKATVLDICLSPSSHPDKIEFLAMKGDYQWQTGAGKIQPRQWYSTPKYFRQIDFNQVGTVECFPLYSVLASQNMFHVDYFSLDVEGSELDVLKTIPFDKIDIKVIQIEHWLVKGGRASIHKFMKSNNYIVHTETKQDFIFIKQ